MAGKQLAKRGGRDLEKPYGPSALLAPDNSGTVIMEDAQVIFRNFSGAEKMYNREGDRNFCVVLDPEIAEAMLEDGWNVKQLKEREEGVPGDFYLQVSVGFKGRPPRLTIISSQGRVPICVPDRDGVIDEREADVLDWVDVAKYDLIIRPYRWKIQEGTPSEKTGIKAYCKTLFVTLNEDYFEQMYAEVPLAEGDVPLAIEAGEQTPDEDLDIVDAELVEG